MTEPFQIQIAADIFLCIYFCHEKFSLIAFDATERVIFDSCWVAGHEPGSSRVACQH